jgi:hypothetical protein
MQILEHLNNLVGLFWIVGSVLVAIAAYRGLGKP